MAFNFRAPGISQAGIAGIGAFTDLAIGGIQADMAEASQAYSNTMRQLSAAQQTNAVVRSEAAAKDNAVRLGAELSKKSLQDKGQLEVSAAAAGVAGGSVSQAMLGLRRSAMSAQDARMRNLNAQLLGADQDKKNITLSAIYGEDISIITRPDPASAMLGLGVSVLDTWDNAQPKGYKIADGARITDLFKF